MNNRIERLQVINHAQEGEVFVANYGEAYLQKATVAKSGHLEFAQYDSSLNTAVRYNAESVSHSMRVGEYVGVYNDDRECNDIYRVVSLHDGVISANDKNGVLHHIKFGDVDTVYITLDKFAWADVELKERVTVTHAVKSIQANKFATEGSLMLDAGYKVVASTQHAIHLVQEIHTKTVEFNWFGATYTVEIDYVALPYGAGLTGYLVHNNLELPMSLYHNGFKTYMVSELNLTNESTLPDALRIEWKPERTQFS